MKIHARKSSVCYNGSTDIRINNFSNTCTLFKTQVYTVQENKYLTALTHDISKYNR